MLKAVSSRSVKKLEIVNLESVIDFVKWETEPIVAKLRQYLSTLHIRFRNVQSLLFDYQPENPTECNYTGKLRSKFSKLEEVIWLGYFKFEDWFDFVEVQHVFRGEGGGSYVFRLEFIERGMCFSKTFL